MKGKGRLKEDSSVPGISEVFRGECLLFLDEVRAFLPVKHDLHIGVGVPSEQVTHLSEDGIEEEGVEVKDEEDEEVEKGTIIKSGYRIINITGK